MAGPGPDQGWIPSLVRLGRAPTPTPAPWFGNPVTPWAVIKGPASEQEGAGGGKLSQSGWPRVVPAGLRSRGALSSPH